MLLLGTEIFPSELDIMDLPTHSVPWLNAAEYEMALQKTTWEKGMVTKNS